VNVTPRIGRAIGNRSAIASLEDRIRLHVPDYRAFVGPFAGDPSIIVRMAIFDVR
jgi:hypothetical protein